MNTHRFSHLENLGDNWPDYKLATYAFALQENAYDIITGVEESPPFPNTGLDATAAAACRARIKEFDGRRHKMFYYLVATQSPGMRYLLRSTTPGDAKGAWDSLMAFFESTTRASIQQLAHKLVEFKQGNKQASEYVSNLLVIRDQLKSAIDARMLRAPTGSTTGSILMDTITVMAMVNGLSPKFDVVKQHLLMDEELTVERCRSRIDEAAQRLDYELAEPNATALVAHQPKSPPCPGCGKTGHSKEKCFILHPELRRKTVKQVSPIDTPPVKVQYSANAWSVKVLAANAVRQPPQSKPGFITFEIDSGASAHFVTTKAGLDDYDPTSSICVEVADKRSMLTTGKGHISNKIQDVHVAPEFGNNLLSVLSLYKDGLATIFHPSHGVLVARAEDLHVQCNEVLCKGRVENDSFLMDIHTSPITSRTTELPTAKETYAAMATKSKTVTKTIQVRDRAELWVRRLGYPSPSRVMKLVQNRVANRIDLPDSIEESDIPSKDLDAYHEGKDQAHPHRDLGAKKSTSTPFKLIHMDVKVVNVESYGRAKYILIIVCDFTRWKELSR
jgi:hypothetical protein